MSQPDLSEFEQLANPKQIKCKVAIAREELTGDDLTNFEGALSTDKGIINSGAIEKWLAARGIKATAVSIANHRNGKCSCG